MTLSPVLTMTTMTEIKTYRCFFETPKHFQFKSMQKTEPLKHTLEALQELVSEELKNCNISDDSDQLKFDKSSACPNFVMNERHKMVRNRLKAIKVKLFPTPAELKFVSAKKAIRDENSKILVREKEKRFVSRAINQLEREFLIRRSIAELSLPALEKEKKEGIRSGVHEITNKKNIKNWKDPDDFLKDVQKAYERLHRNIKHFQYRDKSTPEKQRISPQTRRHENSERSSPVTPNSNRKYKNVQQLSRNIQTVKEDRNNEKMEKTEPKLRNTQICKSRIFDGIGNEGMKVKKPSDYCREKIGNAAERAQTWRLLYYWRVWRKATVTAKKENNKLTRIQKIDSFLMRLTRAADQAHQLENLANSVKCQIIQKKPFPQLNKNERSVGESDEIKKLDEIGKELTISATEAYERLSKGLKMFHPKLQPKLKALSVLSIVKNKYRAETRRVYPTPAFLTEMEKRYKERKTRWENIRKRRLEMEEEKERIMREREEEERKMEELKKRKKLEELKEKRRREKEAEEVRKRERWSLRQQLKLAHDHYLRYLVRKVGYQSWQRLILLRKNQAEKADHHYQVRTCRDYLTKWRKFTTVKLDQKSKKAQELYSKVLLKKCFCFWQSERNEYIQKIQVAIDWAEAKLAEKAFVMWFDSAQAEQWYFMQKTEYAKSYHDRKTREKSFKKWKDFPELMRNERQKEKRKKLWQRKVQEFLPDYQPAFISEI